ncbi:MAG TPA: choice-of-anchor D domain-containing protein, partial [Casimicrobiaceae bacterium]
MAPAISTAQDQDKSAQEMKAASANPNADRSHEAHRFFTPEIMRRRGMPMAGAHAPVHGNAISTQGENSGQGPLIYGGGPVMRDPTNYVIIWNPPGSTFGPNYRATIEQYFKDIGDTPFMEILAQYGDSSGTPVPNTSHYGGTWVDTTPYPQAGTVAAPLVGTDIQASVDRAIAANPTWQPPGLNTMYFVYLGQNIIECKNGSGDTFGCFAGTDSGGKSPPASDGPPNTVKGAGTYCAYHFYFGTGPRVYATMPYASLGACFPNPNLVGYPNGVDQDVVLSPTSHEQFEAYSDPQLNAWADAGGNENGDKCAYTYGQVEPDGTNFVLWGRRYQLQEQWSNQLTYGCIKRAGPGAQLTITGDLDFGTVARGSTASKDVLIQNTASGDLNLLNIRLGTAGTAFSIDPSSPLWGTLLSGESVQVKVNFAPSATASSTFVNPNTLVVDTDQISSETQSIATSASIGLPKAAVSGGLNFGTVCAGGSVDQTITVTNSGKAPLTINSVSIGAGSTAGLSVLPNPTLPQTLPVGGSLTFTVRFSPTTTTGGPISGTVVVGTDDPANPTISVPITGTIGAANVTISSNALDFGGVPTDNRTSPDTADRTVTIGNTGSCALNLTSLTISGPNSSDFSVVGAPTPPVAIANGSSLSVTIRFNPSALGLRTATLSIGTSDPVNPSQSVALTGRGLIPAIQASSDSLVYPPT